MSDDNRPKREALHMLTAMSWALRSPCKRLQCGAVITDFTMSRILSIGYNGPARGLSNDRCRGEQGTCGCLHAEDNAISRDQSGHGEVKILFVTHSPCEQCVQRIINTQLSNGPYVNGGIRRVYFLEPYRDPEPMNLFLSAGIDCFKMQMKHAGQIIKVMREILTGNTDIPPETSLPST